MRRIIRERIEAAKNRKLTLPARPHSYLAPAPAAANVNINVLVAEVMASNWMTVREIAKRHGLSYATVHTAFSKRPGCIRIGRAVRIPESVYQGWIREMVIEGLSPRSVASATFAAPSDGRQTAA